MSFGWWSFTEQWSRAPGFFRGWKTTQLYRGLKKANLRDPYEPAQDSMECHKGFDYCSTRCKHEEDRIFVRTSQWLQCGPCGPFPAEDTVNFMAGLWGSHTVGRGKHVGSQAMNLPRWSNLYLYTRWWFQNMFYFHPEPWANDRIWRAYFSNGLKPPGSLPLYLWINGEGRFALTQFYRRHLLT